MAEGESSSNKSGRLRGKDPSVATQRAVWARSGGICARPTCGAVLYEDPIFFKSRAFGELAHNVASSADGPRGDATRSPVLSDDPDNLILFCPTCHSLVDKPGWEVDYPEALLAQWKHCHEAVIRFAGIHSHGRLALGVRYLGVIGGQLSGGSKGTIPGAALQSQLVLTHAPYDLTLDASLHPPQSPAYWQHVVRQVHQQVTLLQSQQRDSAAIALFALADMPALMALGFGLGHTAEVHPFQWDPNAKSWAFPDPDAPAVEFHIKWPEEWSRPIALVLSLSGDISSERVLQAFPEQTPAIVHVTVDLPRRDLVRSRNTIVAFGSALARVIEQLERQLPRSTPVHVFPAMPASLAVAFGMAIKPKVSLPFCIYDAEGPGGLFHLALSLPLVHAS